MCLNLHPSPIEGCCPAKSVDCQVICHIVDALAGVLLSDVYLNSGSIMSPTMGHTYDARHHLLGYFDWYYYASYSRTHRDLLTRCQLAMRSVNRVHKNCALWLAPDYSLTVMHPGVVAAKLSSSNQ